MNDPIGQQNAARELMAWGKEVERIRRLQGRRDYRTMRKLGMLARYRSKDALKVSKL